MRPNGFSRRAQHILRDCEPSAVYTSADLVDALGRDALLGGLALRTPDSTAEASRRPPAGAATATGEVAFLQYTSGSTGEPKGIVNTHESMLHQLAIGTALWNRPDDIHTVSWLPLYHDLGIFWGVLLALATGGTATVIPPFDFVRNPRIWLETVDEVRGNWIAGPDFAYRLCIDAFECRDATIESLDLSCLHLATNGAEPVRPSTLRDFAAKFRPAGLRADAMAPQYGLAEAGVAVTGTLKPRLWVQASFDAEQLNRGRAVKISDAIRRRSSAHARWSVVATAHSIGMCASSIRSGEPSCPTAKSARCGWVEQGCRKDIGAGRSRPRKHSAPPPQTVWGPTFAPVTRHSAATANCTSADDIAT